MNLKVRGSEVVDSTKVARDTINLRAFVNAAMNFGFHKWQGFLDQLNDHQLLKKNSAQGIYLYD